jgi:phosphoenolpyruvate-protein phosphotransferase (PTS system enzyme I)
MSGLGASPGIAIGKACVLKKQATALTGIKLTTDEARSVEKDRFTNSVQLAVKELESIQNRKDLDLSAIDLDVLETQIQFLTDPQIESDVADKINLESKTALDAVIEVIASMVDLFRNLDDDYLKARADDIRDAGNRIILHLTAKDNQGRQEYPEDTILIADELSPADTILMDLNRIAGFATQTGGRTSHTAIIAKSRGIPAVVGCGTTLQPITDGDTVILDGSKGIVIVNPDAGTMKNYRILRKKFIQEQDLLRSYKDLPATTTDGVHVELSGNISNAEDLQSIFEHGADGVGLFRTELFFLERDAFPSEEEQFEFYRQIAIQSKNRPVIIRTLDIGGDKQLPYFEIPHEDNPFLGYRAIRISLDRKDIFMTQLKAILRAGAFGNFKIMFPMISNVGEVRQAKALLAEAKRDLLAKSINFGDDIKTGIMIEIPAAAAMADILAREVDFFSIGTNDLCQYSLAVDRMNGKVNSLYDPFNPGILRLIRNVIDEAHKNKIPVGMCGEMASDPGAALMLLGMGLDEFSMSAASIPAVKEVIIRSSALEARQICDHCMQLDNSDEIKAYLEKMKP